MRIGHSANLRKFNLGKWAQTLGDLNFQRAFLIENRQWFWDLRPSIEVLRIDIMRTETLRPPPYTGFVQEELARQEAPGQEI